MPDTETLMLKI